MATPMKPSTRSPVEVPRHHRHQAWREQPSAGENAAAGQHLVESGHAAPGREAAATRRAGSQECRIVLQRADREPAVNGAIAHRYDAVAIGRADAQHDVLLQAERTQHPVAHDVAIVCAGDLLDQHRGDPPCRARMVVHPAAGRPFRDEVADHGPEERVISPGLRRHRRGREAALVGQQLEDRDRLFAVAAELRNMLRNRVGERHETILDEPPDRRGDEDLRVRIEQPERRPLLRLLRRAEATVQRQPAVSGDGDLDGMPTPGHHLAGEQRRQALEALVVEPEGSGCRDRQGPSQASSGQHGFADQLRREAQRLSLRHLVVAQGDAAGLGRPGAPRGRARSDGACSRAPPARSARGRCACGWQRSGRAPRRPRAPWSAPPAHRPA